ncbi:MAG: hypothetical protein BMS9Abin37_0185 [Acidobacteriota bacterium]|nr:MAG: hypothetical protein BMS9Abin37_0185 [Acidobacteriota bacterium]
MMQGSYQTTTGPPLMEDVLAPLPVVPVMPVINDNPYQAPQSAIPARNALDTPSDVLAGRGARLAAVLIDYLCMVAVSIPGFAGFLYVETTGANAAAMDLVTIAFAIGLGILGAIQGIYIVRDGQTVGKKMMKIRIVDHVDGHIPTWPRILGMRYILNMALRQVPFYFLVDALLIFGKDQRCIHDHLAGTKVVEAQPASVRQ